MYTFLQGGGEAGALVRSIDWSQTSVGPVSEWPSCLRTTLATLLHSRHPMVLWWGPDFLQFYNDAYTPSFGVGKHPAAMGQHAADCWQEAWAVIGPQLNEVWRGHATYHEDQKVPVWRNGHLEEVFWTYGYSPVFDEKGIVAGCLVVCTETTGRAVASRRLKCLHNLGQIGARAIEPASALQSIAASLAEHAADDIPFALFQPKVEGAARIVAGLESAEATALLEYLRNQPETSTLQTQLYPMPSSIRVTIKAGPEPTEKLAVIRAGESYFAFGLSPRLPVDSPYLEFLGQITDLVTQMLDRLAASRAAASVVHERDNLLLQAPVAIAVLVGPQLVFQLANEPYQRLVHGRAVVGKAYLEVFPELAGTALADVVFGCYRRGEARSVDEMLVPLAAETGGPLEDRYFSFHAEPVRDAAGSAYALMVVAVDTTGKVLARKQAEAHLVEREELVTELEQANQSKDLFLARLGHELRNPLSPILTALQLMRLRGYTQGAEERGIIERQLSHVITLVDDLLDVGRIERGALVLKRETLDLVGVIRGAIEQASPLIEERRHSLSMAVEENLMVRGDAGRLAQVVANLMTNAAKYTSPGGVISVSARKEGETAVVTVRDNGIGLRFGADQLFDTFTREDRNDAGGLGLGLSIVKSLVKAHRGRVELKSEGEGRGTEAIVHLPLARSGRTSSVPSMPAAQSEQTAPTKRRLLVVDDNEDAGALLGMVLRRMGHEVVVAGDGAAALAIAESYVPDVALLDLGMPVMDGYALASQLKNRPEWSGVAFIAVTGYGQASDRERTRQAGFSGHLVKPVSIEEVSATIRALDAPES